MSALFKDLQKTWETLGSEDPLWAIASEADKKGGRWNLNEFLASGNGVVDRYWELLKAHGGHEKLESVLDFGCGVGRLTLAWSRHARLATGVDISGPMIEKGRQLMAGREAVQLELNQRSNLSMFPDASFDLVFSHIVLQHMPWSFARGYIAEFARVCRPGGWVAFQLPYYSGVSQTLPMLRKRVVDRLPFGLAAAYRRWRRGTSQIFEMHFTPPEKVEAILASGQLEIRHREPDESAGADTKGFIYLARKRS
jgi:ubiquinone/menaquinone biosynthesis C-methylase UbiE